MYNINHASIDDEVANILDLLDLYNFSKIFSSKIFSTSLPPRFTCSNGSD